MSFSSQKQNTSSVLMMNHHSTNPNYQSITTNGTTNGATNPIIGPNHLHQNSDEQHPTNDSTGNVDENTLMIRNDNVRPYSSTFSTRQLRPMLYLTNTERRNRYRCIVIMTIVCIGIAITLLLWFYYLHLRPIPIDPYSSSSNGRNKNKYLSNNNNIQYYDQMQQQVANTALTNLNEKMNHNSSSSSSIGDTTATISYDSIPDQCETTLLVFRHCDKLERGEDDYGGDDNSDSSSRRTSKNKIEDRHCSEVGYERAQYIVTLFGTSNTSRWPIPKYLFALSSDRSATGTHHHHNYREYETVLPLSTIIHVPIHNITNEPPDTFANDYYFPLLLQKNNSNSSMCGAVAIVSWKHDYIPQLVNTLGCGPDNGCPTFYPKDTFDQVWELKFISQNNKNIKDNSNSDSTPTQPQSRRQMTLSRRTSSRATNHDNNNDDDTIPSSSSQSVIVEPSISTFHLLRKKKEKKHHHHHHHNHHHHHIDNVPTPPWNTNEYDNNNHVDPTTNGGTQPQQQSRYWVVFGTVTYQMFDPLQYSKQLGSYGTTTTTNEPPP